MDALLCLSVAKWQGPTLGHFSAQRKHSLWDTLGTLGEYMGLNSSQSGHTTSH